MNATATAEREEFEAAADRAFSEDTPAVPKIVLESIGLKLIGEFHDAENARRDTENRWLQDLRQYKGQYEPEAEAAMRGPSRAFFRKTRIKVKSLDARMMDLLFPANKERNYEAKPTPKPSVSMEVRKQIAADLSTVMEGQKPTKKQIDDAVMSHVKKASLAMMERIDDQLAECKYRETIKRAIHSGHLFGTGIIKGPLVERRERVRYVPTQSGGFKPKVETYTVPFLEYVPVWRFYPDMEATSLEDCRYAWHHHVMTREQISALIGRPSFRTRVLKTYIESNPRGCRERRLYELELRSIGERMTTTNMDDGLYDLFERWGWISAAELIEAGMEPERLKGREHESFFANVWLLRTGEVVRVALQQLDGTTWPFHLYQFDPDDTSIFSEGVAAVMRDDQEIINSAGRAMLDNVATTAGPQLEVYLDALTPAAQATANEVYPWKIWFRNGLDPQYPIVKPVNLPSSLPELSAIYALVDNNADEILGIPKFTTGDNPTNGAAETAQGLSMLMGQANIIIKDLVTSFDDGVTKPFITALYRWNMRWSRDESIKGDFDVIARGSTSLVAREVRAQLLAQFVTTVQPEERGYIKWRDALSQRAEANDMQDLVMSEDEFKQFQSDPANQQAQQMQQMAQQLELANLEATVAKTQASAALEQAKAMSERVEAIFAAIQGAGAAAQNAGIAAAADTILQSAGYQDATPNDGVVQGADPQQGQAPGAAPPPGTLEAPAPADPNAGQRAGIETVRIEQ